MLTGNKITLGPIQEDSLEQLRVWRNDPELRKYFREHKEISPSMQKKWFDKISEDANQFNFEIRSMQDNLLIGHCGIYAVNWVARTGEFGIYIGNGDFRNKGYGADALQTLIKYGFEDLNLNKIWCEVFSNNTSIKTYQRVGFTHEGTMRQHYFNEGKYWDSHILSMLKDEYTSIHNDGASSQD